MDILRFFITTIVIIFLAFAIGIVYFTQNENIDVDDEVVMKSGGIEKSANSNSDSCIGLQNVTFVSYQNKQYKFQLQYPNNWKLADIGSAFKNGVEFYGGGAQITFFPTREGSEVAVFNNLRDSCFGINSNTQILELDGLKGELRLCVFSDNSRRGTIKFFTPPETWKDNHLIYFHTTQKSEKEMCIINKILSTLDFL